MTNLEVFFVSFVIGFVVTMAPLILLLKKIFK